MFEELEGLEQLEQKEQGVESASNRTKWVAWGVALASWIASMIFMLIAKDESFPGMPDWVMYLVWFVSQGTELFLVMGALVLFKYGWGMVFSDSLKERQSSFMTGRLFLVCLLSILLGLIPAMFDLWSTNTVLLGWVNPAVRPALLFAKWLALFVVLGSELSLAMSDDVQRVYLRLALVESQMSLVGDSESGPGNTISLPKGLSKGEAHRILSQTQAYREKAKAGAG